jgi:hypothetical protein
MELRTPGLGAKFVARFDEGLLQIQLPTGVTRRVDRDELRATWRLLDQGASPGSLRLVTANGPYIEAVRQDLLDAGVDISLDAADGDVVAGTIEVSLVTEATARAAVSDLGGEGEKQDHGKIAGMTPEAYQALAEERGQLVRDVARLTAALTNAETAAAAERDRADGLDQALGEARKKSATGAPTGPRGNPVESLRRYVTVEAKRDTSLRSTVRQALASGADIAGEHPDLAIVQCRKVLEELAHEQWLFTFAAAETPPHAAFKDLMEELRDQVGVDFRLWHLHRSLYTVANPAAHAGQAHPLYWSLTLLVATLGLAQQLAARRQRA